MGLFAICICFAYGSQLLVLVMTFYYIKEPFSISSFCLKQYLCTVVSFLVFFCGVVTITRFRLPSLPPQDISSNPQILASGYILHHLFLISLCQPRHVQSIPDAHDRCTERYSHLVLCQRMAVVLLSDARTQHPIVRHALHPLYNFIFDSIKI